MHGTDPAPPGSRTGAGRAPDKTRSVVEPPPEGIESELFVSSIVDSTRGQEKQRPGLGLLLVAFLVLATPVGATTEANTKIPPNDFGCTLCHGGSGVTTESVPAAVAGELKPFGQDWLQLANAEAARLWAQMAPLNSDDDGCSNGCELDDPTGAWLPERPTELSPCAPGDPNESDCALPLNEGSWSTLKALFREGR